MLKDAEFFEKLLIKNAAATVLTGIGRRDHFSPTPAALH